jgi:hypothetical protein
MTADDLRFETAHIEYNIEYYTQFPSVTEKNCVTISQSRTPASHLKGTPESQHHSQFSHFKLHCCREETDDEIITVKGSSASSLSHSMTSMLTTRISLTKATGG